jgi:hypothetical protein
MDQKIEAILERFKRRVIFYGSYKRAYSQIQSAIENTQALGEPVCAILRGVSGAGKSTLCKYFKKYYSCEPILRREDGTYIQLPVFYCEVPSSTTVKGMISSMLELLIGETPNGTVEKLTHQLLTCLKTAGVKVIFLDEIQLLCIHTVSEKVRLDSLQWIVSLLNRSGIPVILSGTELCRDIKKSHAPFASRYPYLAELKNFDHDTDHSSDYMSFLKNLDMAMYQSAELDNGVHLNDPTIATALYLAARGNLKKTRLIISDALKYCLERGDSPELKLEDFYRAGENIDLCLQQTEVNPFGLSYSDALILIAEHKDDEENDEEDDENYQTEP